MKAYMKIKSEKKFKSNTVWDPMTQETKQADYREFEFVASSRLARVPQWVRLKRNKQTRLHRLES